MSGNGARMRVLRVSECACDNSNDDKIPWHGVALLKFNTHENGTPYHTDSLLFLPSPSSPLFVSLKVTDIWTDPK